MFVFGVVIKPSRTYARVGFAGTPNVAVLNSKMQHLVRSVAGTVHQAPIGFADVARLGAHPTDVATLAAVVPNQAVRLQLANYLVSFGPLIICSAVDGAGFVGTAIPTVAAVCPVKPNLKHIAIFGEEFAELVAKICNVFGASVIGMVAIPRRKIDGKFQSFRLARLCKFPHNVALAALPRGVFYGIIGKFRRPHTESAVVFGGENNALHT